MEPDAAALRVLDERRRVIEPHRLVVEERRVERRRVMDFEIRARIRQQREAGGVRLGKSVQRERRDRRDDLLRGVAGDALPRHAVAQLDFDLLHPPLGSLEPERAPQLFGLPAGEAGRHHRHAQQLLLKERHAERPRQDRLERRMRIGDRLPSGAPVQIRMHHLPDDRPGTDDRHLHDDVVEAGRLETRQRRHLRARLDLKDADRVGLAQHAIHGRIVLRQMREIDDTDV